jgi:hypothetical protein
MAGGFPPRPPITQGVAEAMAKGIKKGIVPEALMATPERSEEAKTRLGENRPQTTAVSTRNTGKSGILSRLRRLFFSR